ncbi:MAG: hypothetical protein ABIK62_03440, partial [candidate division WOR-3 bacterium]
ANNQVADSVEVRRSSLDVAVLSILAPIGTVDSGTTTMPGAMVKNQGTETVSFTATFRIGDFYSNTQSVRNLGPGESTRVDFDPWIARQPGTHVTLCTTALSGDEVPENNIKSGSVTVRINHTDVSVRRLVTPSGTIDSGLTVTPLAWVRNVGDTMASFPVVLTIGSYYLDTTYVSDLAVGESLSVSFDPWTALVRGAAIAKCSTAATDRNPANDWDTNAVSVRVRDVGVTRIVTPVGIIDSGTTLYPQATVRNFGTAAASFSVRFQIDTFYNVTANVNNLAAGASQTVYFFPGWTASQMGPHVVKCSTQYASDSVAWNNLMVDSCNVIRVTDDVGVVRIVAPTGIVDSGAEVVPQAMVRNYSDSTKSFPVLFRIGATYADTQVVTDLLPNDSLLVSFQSWTASVLGTSVTKCSTMLDGDQAPANNARADSVRVMIITIDLGATQILAPVGTVDSGAVINPKAIVKNLGAGTVDSFAVMMRINVTGIPSWRDTQYVRNLAPGESVEVTFRAWTATWVGTNNVRCSTMLSTDQRPSNNRFWTTITVQRPPQADVGVARIVAPTGTVGAGTVVVPQVMVYNYSQFDVSFPVWFRIDTLPAPALAVPNARSEHVGQVLARSAPASNPAALLAPLAIYEESVWVSLAGGDSTLAEFLRWTANPPGNYYLTSFTALVGDGNRRNDSAFGMVSVVAPVHDVGAVAVLDPVGLVNQGDTIAPRAVVRNFGTQAESFVVRFYVGRDWRDSLAVRVEAGAEESLSFRPWVATMVGTFPVVCSTALTDDGNPDNDRMVDSVFVVATGTAEPRPTRLPVRAMLNVSPSMTFSGTRVFYGLPREQQYRIEVFDLGGHLVQTLARGRAMPGYYAVVWNGLDLRGRPAARGIYVCRLVTEDASLAAKFVKLE